MVPVILTSDLILIERFVVYRPPRTFHSRISFVKKITFTVQRIKIVFDDMKQESGIVEIHPNRLPCLTSFAQSHR